MSRRPHVVVVGDTLLDRDVVGRVERLCPDAPAPVVDVEGTRARPGGAGLAAVLAAADARTTLVTPLSGDAEAVELRSLLDGAGVDVVPLPHEGATRVKTRLRAGGQSIARIDTGGPGRPQGRLPDGVAELVVGADVVLVSCYGAGTSGLEPLRAVLAGRALVRPVVWDPHPRGADPVPGCALVTPNLAEAQHRAAARGPDGDFLAEHLVRRWSARAVAVTCGERGAWVATPGGGSSFVRACAVDGDSCGAGDRFAAAAAVALARGSTALEAVEDAVEAATAFVASGGAGGLRPGTPARADRPGGEAPTGTLVATGGCFDLLHAGHVQLLEEARALGDRLVVMLNSDASVHRLKGPGRPVQTVHDRARVLLGLSCVDDVVVFDDDDPRAALRRLRPDVWVKGGDYTAAELPEAPVVRSWGGRVVILPTLAGRSTTAVLHSIRTGGPS
ncbi:PfkB family carbohydrate kinase [Fodinibacter luteus]|uniref:PfkB family carbohydrate kinase n=1 Tax=Fodinibacter luteus TaxID=552064 RepID=UPI0031E907DA